MTDSQGKAVSVADAQEEALYAELLAQSGKVTTILDQIGSDIGKAHIKITLPQNSHFTAEIDEDDQN